MRSALLAESEPGEILNRAEAGVCSVGKNAKIDNASATIWPDDRKPAAALSRREFAERQNHQRNARAAPLESARDW